MERRNYHNDLHDKIHLFINYSNRSKGGHNMSVGGKEKAKQKTKHLFNPVSVSICTRDYSQKDKPHVSEASQKTNHHYKPTRHPDSNYPGGQK